MIQPGMFYVITVGKLYYRTYIDGCVVVCQSMQQATKFVHRSVVLGEYMLAKKMVKEINNKKPVTIQKVTIKQVKP